MAVDRTPFRIFDSGFNLIAVAYFNGESVVITFGRETKYAAGDRLCLAVTSLKALIGEEKTDEQSAQNN